MNTWIEGQRVIVRRTNCYRVYESRGEITRVNGKSLRILIHQSRMVADHGQTKATLEGHPLPTEWITPRERVEIPMAINGTRDNRVDPDPDYVAPDEEEIRASREAKRARLEAKIERYRGYQANAAKRSDAAYDNSREMADMIPLGQPILVDHYSAPRHRRHLARIDALMRHSIEEDKKADYWSGKIANLQHQIKALGL